MLDGGSGAPQALALCPPRLGTQPGQRVSFSSVTARAEVGLKEGKDLAARSPQEQGGESTG